MVSTVVVKAASVSSLREWSWNECRAACVVRWRVRRESGRVKDPIVGSCGVIFVYEADGCRRERSSLTMCAGVICACVRRVAACTSYGAGLEVLWLEV